MPRSSGDKVFPSSLQTCRTGTADHPCEEFDALLPGQLSRGVLRTPASWRGRRRSLSETAWPAPPIALELPTVANRQHRYSDFRFSPSVESIDEIHVQCQAM